MLDLFEILRTNALRYQEYLYKFSYVIVFCGNTDCI